MWVCASIRPGSTVEFERSSRSTSAGGAPPGVMLTILPSSIRIRAFGMAASLLPSISLPARMAIGFFCADGVGESCAKVALAARSINEQAARVIRFKFCRIIFRLAFVAQPLLAVFLLQAFGLHLAIYLNST